jgi:putative ABC transport system permease protein
LQQILRPEDAVRNTPVALLNEAMARRFWPTESPVGQRITLDGANEPSREIIGVVGDLRQDRRAREAEMQIYVPNAQLRPDLDRPEVTRTFVVRAADNPTTLIPAMRAVVGAETRGLPIFNIKGIDAYIAEQLWQPRQTMILLSVFSVVALLLAMSGIFGIVSYMVGQRTHEIGIRIALGATKRDVMRLVMAHGLTLVALGIGGGVFGSLALASLLKGLLWGVSGTDTASYGVSITLLIATTVLACYLPARQSLRIDPFAALRTE